MNENSMVSKPKTPSQSNSLSLVLAAVTLGSVILINGCSQSGGLWAESVSDESSDYASEESVAADTNALMSEQPTAAEELEANSQANELTVESLSGDSEQTLGSQVADIQIKGKSLLITSSADFTVKDVVKSSAAIEALTLAAGWLCSDQ